MAFGHEKLDSASEGMLFARNRANTERKKSPPIPIPTPTPKEAMTGNRKPTAVEATEYRATAGTFGKTKEEA